MRQMMVAGNWKMHGSVAFTREIFTELTQQAKPNAQVKLLVCPPMVYLSQAIALCQGSAIEVGAQNLACVQCTGAYTGEVSAAMLADLGCRYVIVGHSERRSLYGEGDDVVAEKVKSALAENLTPLICVGETLLEREAGCAEAVIANQLASISQVVGVEGWQRSIIAYEPVWAIGTGKTATPEQAQAIHAFIRQELAQLDATMAAQISILYGGSVKADNAAAIFSQPDVDGGLIGGASLVASDFLHIYAAACAQL